MLGNWFYDNYIILNPGKYELMSFGKAYVNGVFTYYKIEPKKKTVTEKMLDITIDKHLQ